ncbi:MFS transporter [Pedomonas mirosovicensis]|uniref:MFS transporter n=1 Tax=Pedomonas mirosovicensis TaxID=2908641 RepID=UPI002166F760|nr:MFS transporter [Pedomonas mirosovicensis]MCH8686123.1 MFS transporter [Pedomonas mirosovicensis]
MPTLDTAAPDPGAQPKTAFAFRDFRFFWAARFLGSFSTLMSVVGIGWLVYEIARRTHSIKEASLYLGLIGLVQFAALAGCTLFAGYVADHVDRRWVARGAIMVEIFSAAWLFTHTVTGIDVLWPIFVSAALMGVGRAFMGPALQSLAPNLVPRDILPSAIAWNSIAWQTAAVGGPAACGYLMALGPQWVFGTCLVMLCLALLCMFCIRPVARTAVAHKAKPWRSIVAGLKYIRTNRIILGAISLDLFAVLLGSATAMLPVFARDVLMVGPEGLGNLRAAPAVGAALVALVLTRGGLRHNVGLWMFSCVGLFGLCTVVFGLSKSFPLSMAALIVLGGADMISVYVRQSLEQLYTPDDMRGRVASVSTLFVSASNELGEFQSGLMARLLGAVPSVIVGGIGALIVTGLWAWAFPELRKANKLVPPEPIPAKPVSTDNGKASPAS